MKVLSLVTNRYATFYQKQIEVLEYFNVEFTHVFPQIQSPDHGERQEMSRSVFDYARMYPTVLRESMNEFDLIHANNGKTAPFALTQPRRPVVLTLWGSDLAGKYGTITKRCAQYCDEVIVRNEEMRRELGRDAHVIPAGIDLEQFKPSPQLEAQREVGWDPSKKHVLFPYSPSRSVKNYPLAEQVVEQVNDECLDEVRLQTVYGIDHDDVPMYMNAADALLLTSHREGSPNAVKEAMACNTPVVSTDVGDVRKRLGEVTHSAVCKNQKQLSAELLSILTSDSKSDGRETVRELSLENMALQIIDVYKKAMSER